MIKAIRQEALKFLARRDHSRHELQRKLASKGWDKQQIDAVLCELAADDLQNDERFLSGYIRYRRAAGYGPRRILAELAERGIHEAPEELLDENTAEWQATLGQVWRKKFKSELPRDLKTKAKQTRFLIYRGFSPEQVQNFLNE